MARGVLPPHHHNRLRALFPGPPGWAGARRELLDFMVQGKINRSRHTNRPVGRHSIRTNQCPPPRSPFFYRPDALLATQPTVSKHWTQLCITVVLMKWKCTECIVFTNIATTHLADICQPAGYRLAVAECKHDITLFSSTDRNRCNS